MKNAFTAALLLAALSTITACKQDEDVTPTPTPTDPAHNATVRMSFAFMKGENAYALDSIISDSLGHKIKLTSMRFYIGGGHAMDDDDNEIGHYEDAILLVDASQANDFAIGSIHAVHVHAFHLHLGLESDANHLDITGAEPPLDDAGMYLGSTTDGRAFLKITGNIVDNNGTPIQSISYTCSTDALLGEAEVHAHHDIVEGETFTAEAMVDMSQLFAGVDAMTNPTATAADPVCQRLMINLSGAIDGMEE